MYWAAQHRLLIALKSYTVRALICALCVFASGIREGHAQNTQPLHLVIQDGDTPHALGDFLYLIDDAEQSLTPQAIETQIKTNTIEHNASPLIYRSNDKTPFWASIHINNQTGSTEWIINFNDAFHGRHGFLKTIYVLNQTTQKTFLHPPIDEDHSAFLGRSIPLTLAPDQINHLIFFIEPDHGMPVSLSPRIMTKDVFIQTLSNGNTVMMTIAYAATLLFALFFIACYYLHRTPISLALTLYHVMLFALLLSANASLASTTLLWNGKTLYILHHIVFIVIIITTKYFIKCAEARKSAPLTYTIFAVIISAFAIIGLVGSFFSHYAIYISSTAIFCMLIIASIYSYSISQRQKNVILPFCIGLICAALAYINVYNPAFGVISPTHNILNIQWVLTFASSLSWILAYEQANRNMQQRKHQKKMRTMYEQQSKARIQKSRNAADQARLLRLIERERELMSELREREVQRTEDMRVAKDSADKANQAKSAFLAVVSHEIRTPMNGILGMVQMLQDTPLNTTQKDYVNMVRKSGETMIALLSDILDFEKIEHGSMALENVSFDLKQLAHDIVMLMSGHAAQKNIMLDSDIAPDIPTHVLGDPTRLRQVLLNLVNNALKFTEKGSVTIIIARDREQDDAIYFAVKDTGIGISEAAQAKLFTPFTQAEESTTRKFGGTGLGLAISKRLINAMESEIKVASVENEGTTFYFSVNLPPQDAPQIIQQDTHSNALLFKDDGHDDADEAKIPPLHILVVEDNELNRKVVEAFLKQDGHTLQFAEDGFQALNILHDMSFDLILMDIQMDGLSGLDVTHRIRASKDEALAMTPIIALTGNVTKADVETYTQAGMDAFIGKPIDRLKLKHTMREITLNASPRTSPPAIADTPTNLSFAADDNTSILLQSIAQEQQHDADIPQKPKSMMSISHTFHEDDYIDKHMLESLKSSLAQEHLRELIEGFIEKSHDIIAVMHDIIEDNDMTALHARGHELKGMAANFGMKAVRELAEKIEQHAKANDLKSIKAHMKNAPKIMSGTQNAIESWLQS